MINDLRQYKFAKVVVEDMTKIIPRIEACIIFLEPYKSYSQVGPIIDECKQRLTMLKAQNNRYKAIIKNKGKR